MTGSLVLGDQVSCSRVGGVMRRESARLRQRAQALAVARGNFANLADLAATRPCASNARVDSLLRALNAAAEDLDLGGAALQRYATELAEAHELGRRAERRVRSAGLLLQGTRVVEPWGPASTQEAERRRAQVPEVQSRVDLATAHVGRARGRLNREMARLAQSFSADSVEAYSGQPGPPPPRGS
ncbi:MAG: hypothetical protein QOF35_2369 [Actinomycetota bacterium]|jgi:hypothetical protein|nr:hypothetical protein [Actinomycetota bacterium]